MRPIAGPAFRSTAASAHRTWASIGLSRLDEQRRPCSAGGSATLFGGGGSTSLFLDVEARRDLGNGWSATRDGAGAAGPISPAASSRRRPMRFDLAKYRRAERLGDRLGLRIAAAAADRTAAGSR